MRICFLPRLALNSNFKIFLVGLNEAKAWHSMGWSEDMEEAKREEESFAELLAQQTEEPAGEKLQAGQKVKGRIIAVSGDSVFIDLGLKQDGVMDRSEIQNSEGSDTVAEGDEIEAWVVRLSPQGAHLSKAMTGVGAEALEEAKAAGLPVDGRIIGPCKGGYQVEVLGRKAFCPGSQMDLPAGDGPEALAGISTQFLVTRVENNGRNIVVSRRALAERERKENLDKLLSSINIGDIVEGRVSRLTGFGAFVELAPSVEGLVHISELSWSKIDKPDEAVSVDDRVRVKVIGMAQDEKGQHRISLSLRKTQDDPWKGAADRFAAGDIIEGKVVRLVPFGAFIEIAPGIEGLAHISELSWEKRVTNPEEILAPGDKLPVRIRDINADGRRISLSVRDAQGDPWADIEEKFPAGLITQGIVVSKGQHGLFVTLAPGITGLVPQGIINKSGQELARVAPGESVEVQVRSVDPSARRISLAPASGKREDEKPSKQPSPAPARQKEQDFGIMAMALQKAFAKK